MSPDDRRSLSRLMAERDRARAEYLRAEREIHRDTARRGQLLRELDRTNAIYSQAKSKASEAHEQEPVGVGAEVPAGAGPSGLAEPLSEREVEVLKLLAAGLSRSQVAAALFVSLSTVKTHARHAYRKLDAHNRAEAVARAMALNLIRTGLRRPS